MGKNEDKIWGIYSTFPHREEALSVAAKLLEQKLIACANLFENVTSLYHWEGTLRQENEVVMLAKTSAGTRHAAIETLTKLHPYDLPCITATPIEEAHPPFAQWVTEQTLG